MSADSIRLCRSGIDMITGERFSWALQPNFVSADGLCSTAGINAGDLSINLYNQVRNSCVIQCMQAVSVP